MEALVKKYQHKFNKVKDELDHWDDLNSHLLSQFRNASAVIQRFQVIQNSKNYSALHFVDGIGEAVLQKQMESLQAILLAMKKTMEELHHIILFLEKMQRDGRQLIKGGSNQSSVKQLQQRIGVKPSLMDCAEGLAHLFDMYHAEVKKLKDREDTYSWQNNMVGTPSNFAAEMGPNLYLLKSSIVSSVSSLALKPSSCDLATLQRLLVDQPNIPREEVQFIFDVILAEEIS